MASWPRCGARVKGEFLILCGCAPSEYGVDMHPSTQALLQFFEYAIGDDL